MHYSHALQQRVSLSATNDELMRTLGKVEDFRNELIVVEGAISPPANDAGFEAGNRRDIPDHVRVLRLSINIDVERVSAGMRGFHQRLNHVVSRIRNRKTVGGTSTISNAGFDRLVDVVVHDDKGTGDSARRCLQGNLLRGAGRGSEPTR